MPITLTGLHALSVLTPTTVSIGSPFSRMARMMFSRPRDVRLYGLVTENIRTWEPA
jgi:hypothetical protein